MMLRRLLVLLLVARGAAVAGRVQADGSLMRSR
jgi:hypothetical protein